MIGRLVNCIRGSDEPERNSTVYGAVSEPLLRCDEVDSSLIRIDYSGDTYTIEVDAE